MPNVNGKFVLIQAFRCGNKWHVGDVVFMDTTSTEDIRSSILSHESDSCVIECTDAYFPFIRELRSSTNKEIRVMKEFPDVDKRISCREIQIRNLARLMSDSSCPLMRYLYILPYATLPPGQSP